MQSERRWKRGQPDPGFQVTATIVIPLVRHNLNPVTIDRHRIDRTFLYMYA
jgi:hypothetical protein